MNNKLAQVVLISHKINRKHVQMLVALLALAMLILGIGAPSDGGGPTRGMVAW